MIPRLPKGFTHPVPIGKGSFSSVYRVRQTALDRWVAIKILAERSPDRRRGLLEEARRQAQIRIAGIPAIYDAFLWRGQVCIVMQWIRGVTLEQVVERGVDAALRSGLAAAAVGALAALHRLGFAHRDLKPANILVSPEGGLFLVDFGLAKKVEDGNRTLEGVVVGTPAYMAPELWRADIPADPLRADLFALGRILRRLNPGAAWDHLIQSLLAEDPAARPASAVAVWSAHEDLLAGQATPDWEALAGAASTEQLARLLLHAAKELLFAGRVEEAYWLTVECLEVDPDSAEALDLMDRIPDLTRRRTRLRRLGLTALAAGFALAITGAFLAGRRTQARPFLPGLRAARPLEAMVTAGVGQSQVLGSPLPLREIAGRGGLTGRLIVFDAGHCSRLLLDGRPASPGSLAAGILLKSGEHLLACREGGATGRRERFTLLPFQKKVLRLAPARRES